MSHRGSLGQVKTEQEPGRSKSESKVAGPSSPQPQPTQPEDPVASEDRAGSPLILTQLAQKLDLNDNGKHRSATVTHSFKLKGTICFKYSRLASCALCQQRRSHLRLRHLRLMCL